MSYRLGMNLGFAFFVFEIYHREHYDTDFRIIQDLKESVDYFRPFIKE